VYHRQLEALIAFASSEPFKEQLLKAKAHYFSNTGEVFEDDKSFEMRMASFLDYYLYDWVLPEQGKTPAQLFVEQHSEGVPPEDVVIRRGLTETRHSLWEVRKLGKEFIRLRDCFTAKDQEVFERRQPAGLNKGDLIEARLVPCDGRYFFSTAFCFHPEEVRKNITKEIKRLKKASPSIDCRQFIWTLSKMRLKLERYRNIAPHDIYSFERKTI